jgi:hypothetical protein
MRLSAEELERYRALGYVERPGFLQPAEVDRLRAEIARLAEQDAPGRVLERDGRLVRALHGCHQTNDVCRRLTELPRMVGMAEQVLGGRVYVHQFKINFKAAFGGDVWQWHQDYIFWRKEDGMRAPHVLNVMVFVDDVTEFNGPLMVIPGSHRAGMIDVDAKDGATGAEPWMANFSADLKYSLDQSTIAALVADNGIVAPKGPAGTALVFHPNLAHASVPNLSPFNRTMLIVTYNRVDNVPVAPGEPRPEFLVSRDATPLVPVADDALV